MNNLLQRYWLKRIRSHRAGSPQLRTDTLKRRDRSHLLSLECLEDRLAPAVTAITLADFYAPQILDFNSATLGPISGTAPLFTDFALTSVAATGSNPIDAFTSGPDSSRALWANDGGLQIVDAGTVGLWNSVIYTLTFANDQQRFGLAMHDQNSNYTFTLFDDSTEVGTITYPANGTVFQQVYFESTDAFNRVTVASTGGGAGGFAIDNITIDYTPPTNLIVTTLDDELDANPENNLADLSLREAIFLANRDADINTITFAGSLSGDSFLNLGDLDVATSMNIVGPGADVIGISGNGAQRIFNIDGPGTLVVAISGLTLFDGVASADGGGAINITNETVTLSELFIRDSLASGTNGGAVRVQSGTLTIANSTLSNNQATDGGSSGNGQGGAVQVGISATLLMENCTLSGNTATNNGGGVSSAGGAITITHSTITGNTADSDNGGVGGVGGGIFVVGSGAARVLENTIVAGNVLGSSAASDIAGSVTGAYNLIGIGGSGGLADEVDGNQVGVDVATVLDFTLADNGGPTPTHALLTDSPAIDLGDPGFAPPPDFDQRGPGFARVINDRVDIGAFEVAFTPADHFETGTWVDYSTNTGWSPQVVGDFDGDGKDDVANFLASNGGWYVSPSTGTSFQQPLRWVDLANSGFTQHLVGDFNGDKMDDIASFYSPNGVWYVSISNGTSFTNSGWVDLASTGWITQQVGDFNGDCRDDIASLYSDGRWYVSISTGTGFTNSSWNTVGTGWTRLVVGDFNGDSMDDVAGFRFSTGAWYVSLSSGTNFGPSTVWDTIAASWVTQLVGDFNNDGMDDIAGLYSGDGRWYVSLSSGADFTTVGWGPSNGTSGWTRHVVADFNGDGIDDIAGFRNIDGSWWNSISTASTFDYTRWADLVNGGWSSPVTGNFNGDDYADVAAFRTVTGTWHVGLAQPPVVTLKLHAAAITPAADAGRLTQAQLDATVARAFSIFANLGVDTTRLGGLSFVIADLAGNTLGQAGTHAITLDVNAAGHGWSLGDEVDADDVDLLSVVLHELGHELGLEHGDAAFMAETIGLGERRLPTAAELDALLAVLD